MKRAIFFVFIILMACGDNWGVRRDDAGPTAAASVDSGRPDSLPGLSLDASICPDAIVPHADASDCDRGVDEDTDGSCDEGPGHHR